MPQPPAPKPKGGGGGGGRWRWPHPNRTGGAPGARFTYSGFGELNWEALAQAESGGNWSMNNGNGFYGGLQFDQATWNQYGGQQFAQRADLADKSDQINVATALFNARGTQPWPANGWLLTATPEQLNQAGLTGSGRQSTSAGTRGRGSPGGGGGGSGFGNRFYGGSGGVTPSGGGGGLYSPANTYPALNNPAVTGGGGLAAGDAALLAGVPSGRYLQTQAADLTQGIGDCSSAVEDLINMMSGLSTAGRSLSTGNATAVAGPAWLHGEHHRCQCSRGVQCRCSTRAHAGHLPGG